MSDAFNKHWFSYTGPNGIKGYLNGIDKALSLSDDQTIIVTGNTSKDPNNYLYYKEDIRYMRELHLIFSDRVKTLNKKGFLADKIAQDKKIDELAFTLSAYDSHSPYIKDLITEAFEVDSDNCYKLTEKQLTNYEGFYKQNENSNIEILVKQNRLFAREEGAFLFELTPSSETKFDFKAMDGNNYIKIQYSPNGEIKGLATVLEKDGWWFNVIKEGIRKKI